MRSVKKVFVTLAAIGVVACSASAFTACKEDLHEHDWGEWTTVTAATCETGGKEERVCKHDSSHKEERATDPLGHDWDEWEEKTAATCETAGKEERVCKHDSSHKEERDTDALGHDWGEWKEKTAATCGDAKVEESVCKNNPEHTKTRNVGEADDQAHDWGEWKDKAPATCMHAKVQERVCKHNKEHTEERYAGEPDTQAHDWGEWEDKAPATCTHAKVQVRVCKHNKEHTEERYVGEPDPQAHDWGEWEEEAPADCNHAQAFKRVCKHNAEHEETKNEGDPLSHDWSDDWTVLWDKDSGGQASKTCARDGCEEHKSVELPRFGDEAVHVEDSANCTLPGYVTYTYTDGTEGMIVLAQENSPAKGHNMGAAVKTDATDTAKGYFTWACGNEGCIHTEIVGFDEEKTGYPSGYTEDKTYYVNNSNTSTDPEAAPKALGMGFQNLYLKKGDYVFDFIYTDSQAFTIQNGTRGTNLNGKSFIVNNAVSDVYKNNIAVEFTDGRLTRMTVKVDGVTLVENIRFTFIQTAVLASGESTGYLLSIKFTEDRSLAVGTNSVKVTEANMTADGSADKYTFTSETEKTYGMTVPEGLMVVMDGKDFIVDDTWANFNVAAGETVTFTFISSATGTFTVTVGDAKADPDLIAGEPKENFTITPKAVASIKVSKTVTQGKYKLTIDFSNARSAFMSGYICMALNGDPAPEFNDFNKQNTDYTYAGVGVRLGASGHFQTMEPEKYTGQASPDINSLYHVVYLDLKGGDVLYFSTPGTMSGKVTLTLEAVSE